MEELLVLELTFCTCLHQLVVAVQDCTIYATVVSHGFEMFVTGRSHFFY